MLEKKKRSKKVWFMLLMLTAFCVCTTTAYAATYQGKTIRGWTYKFVGNYNSKSGAASASTKASFTKHAGCYTEVKMYVANQKPYLHYKNEDNYVSATKNVGKNNSQLRIMHGANSAKGNCYVGGHTIY